MRKLIALATVILAAAAIAIGVRERGAPFALSRHDGHTSAVLAQAITREEADANRTNAPFNLARPFIPPTWMAALNAPRDSPPQLISCLDRNHDARINAADDPTLAGLDIPLVPSQSCLAPTLHADYYTGNPTDSASFTCNNQHPAPALIVAIGGGGTDLLDPSSGVSLGLIEIVNGMQSRASTAGIATLPILAASAVFGSDHAQTQMEQWLAHDLTARLDAMPCLRAVLIGHSHGGVVVTSVLAALEDRFAGRLYGVLLDRSIVLYDHAAMEWPRVAPVLNVFQTNEGWHGDAMNQSNVTNVDESSETAPFEPLVALDPIVRVTHTNLDDAPAARHRIIDATLAWLSH